MRATTLLCVSAFAGFLAALFADGCQRQNSAMPPERKTRGEKGTMNPSDREYIPTQLENCERTGKLEGTQIEYWTGGGLPPPYYRSDQLRLLTSGGRDLLEFSTLRWDKKFDPPGLQEKFSLPARPSDIKDVARLLRDARVFVNRYSEEERPGIADILSTEIMVSAGGRQEKRTYYRRLPDALAPLKTRIEELIDLAKREGQKGLYHQGKRIE